MGIDVSHPRSPRRGTTIGRDDIDPHADEFCGEAREPIEMALGEAGFDDQIGTPHVAETGQALLEHLDVTILLMWSTVEESSHSVDPGGLSRLRDTGDQNRRCNHTGEHTTRHCHGDLTNTKGERSGGSGGCAFERRARIAAQLDSS